MQLALPQHLNIRRIEARQAGRYGAHGRRPPVQQIRPVRHVRLRACGGHLAHERIVDMLTPNEYYRAFSHGCLHKRKRCAATNRVGGGQYRRWTG